MQTYAKFVFGLIIAIFFTHSIHLSAQNQPIVSQENEQTVPSLAIAEIEFEQTSYDFGTIKEGEVISHVFTFTNTSQEPLVLANAKGSCGCTVSQWPREAIAPGETASVTVSFNSKNKKGKRNQKVTLTANTNPPQTFIYLTGEVIPRKEGELEIPNIEETASEPSSDCFFIYPNPTAELLKLDMEESRFGQTAIISIYSETGQLMAKREIQEVNGVIEFNVSHYPAGIYIANVQVGESKPESRCFVVMD